VKYYSTDFILVIHWGTLSLGCSFKSSRTWISAEFKWSYRWIL